MTARPCQTVFLLRFSCRVLEHSPSMGAALLELSLRRYCYRQAELGIGDCGGLRYIPGGPALLMKVLCDDAWLLNSQ